MGLTRSHSGHGPIKSPRGSKRVLLAIEKCAEDESKKLHSETHPLPRGGTDLMDRGMSDCVPFLHTFGSGWDFGVFTSHTCDYSAAIRVRSSSAQSQSTFTSSGVSFVPGCNGV